MIKPDQIPDEVVEALLAHLNTCECRECTAETIAAMLNAWPMATTENREVLSFGNNIDGPIVSAKRVPFIVLPLMENTNDKA